MRRRLSFWWRYQTGSTPWDTNITPPELVSLADELSPGRALDVGCGTGTNAVYLAARGWDVVGVDFVAAPLRVARRKASAAGVRDRTRFVRGSAAALGSLKLEPPFDLAVDIGCSHGLNHEDQRAFANDLASMVRPEGVFLVYMFRPSELRQRGLHPHEVEELFSPHFSLVWSDSGTDVNAGNVSSAWYRFQRNNGS